MTLSSDFSINFSYENDDFSLVKNNNSSHPIKINGVNYEVIGNPEKLEEVYKLLNSIPLKSVPSENDLKNRLSKLKGIYILTAQNVQKIGKRHVVGDSKTTADIKERRPIRPRALSDVGQVAGRLTEKEEIAKKSGELWECVGRKPDRGSNGYLYTFKLKEEFDSVTPSNNSEQRMKAAREQINKIYPAVELAGEMILYLDPKVSEETFINKYLDLTKAKREQQVKLLARNNPLRILFEESLEDLLREQAEEIAREVASAFYARRDWLMELGYKVEQKEDGLYLTLPDRETLLAHWSKLQEKTSDLPSIDIVSSEGIASDIAFIEANLLHDIVLSEGKEFIHDHLVHAIGTMSIIRDASITLGHGASAHDKWLFVRTILTGYRKLMIVQKQINDKTLNIPKEEIDFLNQHLDKLFLGLSFFVDTFTSLFDRESQSRELPKREVSKYNKFSRAAMDPQMSNYLTTRFGAENEGIARLEELWNKITNIEKSFDEAHKKAKKAKES